MGRKELKINPGLIKGLYWDKKLSQSKIAGRFSVDQSAVCKYMKRHKISARHNGFTPWNKGKHGVFSKDALCRMSEANIKKIDLTPTKELGYFCGLVIGDGSLYHSKRTRNYNISLESTKKEIVEVFCKVAKKLGLNPLGIYTRKKTRKFPNGSIRTDLMKLAMVSSKVLYDALRPYKQKDYHWDIPKFLTTKESLFGFLGGIFDAEGSRSTTGLSIDSKHKENLAKLKDLLQELGFIYGAVSIGKETLLISGFGNIRLFGEETELHLKKEKVRSLLINRPRYHPREEYEKVIRLRKENGFGGLRISKVTGIPISTIEDWIYKGKKPWELKVRI